MRDYIDKQVTPPKQVTSSTLGPPHLFPISISINWLDVEIRCENVLDAAKKKQELTEETKASPSGRRAKSSEPLAEKITVHFSKNIT